MHVDCSGLVTACLDTQLMPSAVEIFRGVTYMEEVYKGGFTLCCLSDGSLKATEILIKNSSFICDIS